MNNWTAAAVGSHSHLFFKTFIIDSCEWRFRNPTIIETQIALNTWQIIVLSPAPCFLVLWPCHKRVEAEKPEFESDTIPSYLNFSLHHLHRTCIILTKFGSKRALIEPCFSGALCFYPATTRTSTNRWKSAFWLASSGSNPIPFPPSKWFICGSRVESLCSLPLQFPRPCSTMQPHKIHHFYRLIWSWSASKIFRCLEQVQVNCRSVNDHTDRGRTATSNVVPQIVVQRVSYLTCHQW